MNKNTSPFNNSIETGLRLLCLLNSSFPQSHDVQTLIYLDYLTVHSGDVKNGIKSLHPPTPNRTGEILIRRAIIEDGLNFFIQKGLINIVYSTNGIEYKASEEATPFLESMTSTYFEALSERSQWVINHFSEMTPELLKNYIRENISPFGDDINFKAVN